MVNIEDFRIGGPITGCNTMGDVSPISEVDEYGLR